MSNSPELTRAEEQVMQVLWKRGPAFTKDVQTELALTQNPPPALTTVSTIVRILEQKGFVGHEAFGRTHRYFAQIKQDDYRRFSLRKLLGGHFGGSFGRLLSFFAKEENLDAAQLGELLRHAYQHLGSPKDEQDDEPGRPA